MQNFIISHGLLAEVQIPSSQTVAAGLQINFKDIPQLRNHKRILIHGIEAFCDTQLSKTPQGNTVLAAAAVKTVVLCLKAASEDVVFELPLYSLISSNNAGLIRQLAHLPIDFTQSYIKLVDTGATAGHTIPFYFYFRTAVPAAKK